MKAATRERKMHIKDCIKMGMKNGSEEDFIDAYEKKSGYLFKPEDRNLIINSVTEKLCEMLGIKKGLWV